MVWSVDVPDMLDLIAQALARQARPTSPVIAPVIVYTLAVAAGGAVVVAGAGVAESAANRLAESGVGRGLARLTPELGDLGAGVVPGETYVAPVWNADP